MSLFMQALSVTAHAAAVVAWRERRAGRSRAVGFPTTGVSTARYSSTSVSRLRLVREADPEVRLRELQDACALLSDGFEDLEQYVRSFVRLVPWDGRASCEVDAERFLDWLTTHAPLTVEQQDYLTCLQSRQAVEFIRLKRWLAHVRFQALLSASEESVDQFATSRRMVVHLNPIRVWATFESHVLLESDTPVPANVLFFPVGDEIRTAVVDAFAEQLILRLEEAGPLGLRALLRGLPADSRHRTTTLLAELLQVGIIAVG
jgi:hypothetical protein